MNKSNGPVWVLFLNDMRMSHIEMVEPVAKGDTREEIEKFLEAERESLYIKMVRGLNHIGPAVLLSGIMFHSQVKIQSEK